MKLSSYLLLVLFAFGLSFRFLAQDRALSSGAAAQDTLFTRERRPEGPWAIHVLRIPRRDSSFVLHVAHAGRHAIGLGTLTTQALQLSPELGTAVGGINGDFYERQGPYAGKARGLTIIEGELVSAAAHGASFWMDALGEPHADNVSSRLAVIWPNGGTNRLGLNEECRPDRVVLFTPAMGKSTRTHSGREFVLDRAEQSPWLPLHPGREYHAQVREVHEGGNSALPTNGMVLSIGAALVRRMPTIAPGAELVIRTQTEPSVHGAREAISGGPILVRKGRAQRIAPPDNDSYQSASEFERHPRSAIGWNDTDYFLVEVDGRQRKSVGMTLKELADYLARLGCTDAVNLDGGGSATLWYDGQVRNTPCDGHERALANSIIVTKVSHRSAVRSGTNAPSGTATR